MFMQLRFITEIEGVYYRNTHGLLERQRVLYYRNSVCFITEIECVLLQKQRVIYYRKSVRFITEIACALLQKYRALYHRKRALYYRNIVCLLQKYSYRNIVCSYRNKGGLFLQNAGASLQKVFLLLCELAFSTWRRQEIDPHSLNSFFK